MSSDAVWNAAREAADRPGAESPAVEPTASPPRVVLTLREHRRRVRENAFLNEARQRARARGAQTLFLGPYDAAARAYLNEDRRLFHRCAGDWSQPYVPPDPPSPGGAMPYGIRGAVGEDLTLESDLTQLSAAQIDRLERCRDHAAAICLLQVYAARVAASVGRIYRYRAALRISDRNTLVRAIHAAFGGPVVDPAAQQDTDPNPDEDALVMWARAQCAQLGVVSATPIVARPTDGTTFDDRRDAADRPRRSPRAAAAALSLLGALDAARTVEAEMAALAGASTTRTGQLVRQYWGLEAFPAPTLEALGTHYGITRERVRQIVRSQERIVQELAPRTPLAIAAVDILRAHGSVLTDHAFAAVLHAANVPIADAGRRVLPVLGTLGVVPRVVRDRATGLWLTGAALTLVGGPERPAPLDLIARAAGAVIRRSVARYGAVRLAAVHRAIERAVPELATTTDRDAIAHLVLQLVDAASRRWEAASWTPTVAADSDVGADNVRVAHGWAISRERFTARRTRFTRIVSQMVVTAPGLSVGEIARGLARARYNPRRARLRRPPLPLPVLRAALAVDPTFRLEQGRVYLAVPIARSDLLRGPIGLIVDAIDRFGGAALGSQIEGALREAGLSPGWLRWLATLPMLAQVGPSRYAVRGRIPRGLREARPWSGERRRHLRYLVAEPASGPRIEWRALTLIYRLVPDTIASALPLPRRVGAAIAADLLSPAAAPWQILATDECATELATVPTIALRGVPGQDAPVLSAPTAQQVVISGLGVWCDRCGLRAGDGLAVLLDRATRVVSLVPLSPGVVAEATARHEADQQARADAHAARQVQRRAEARGLRSREARRPLRTRSTDRYPLGAERPTSPEQSTPLDEPSTAADATPRVVRVRVWQAVVEVPAPELDLARYGYAILPDLPTAGHSLLAVVFHDCPLPSGVSGVVMACLGPLDGHGGRPGFRTELIERALLTDATWITYRDAIALVPNIEAIVQKQRWTLGWRWGRPHQ